jgi:site-specific DNA recombinase
VKVAIYARLSRDRNGESTSIDRQIADCRRRIEDGWTLVDIYQDNDLSGWNPKVTRPEWERLLQDIDDGKVDAVITWALDRLARRPKEVERLLETGVRLIAHKNGIDSINAPETSELIIRILAAVAKMESGNTSTRIKSKHQELRESGKWSGGRRAFGLTEDWSELVLHEADLIRKAADHIVAGKGTGSIAREWNDAGYLTRTGKRWDLSSVRRMLLSPRMVGRRWVGSELSPVGMPAVLDEDTWERVRRVLTEPNRRTADGNRVKYLLAGFMVCGNCGGRMMSHTKLGAKTSLQRRYQCRKDHGGCGKVSINATPAEAQVLREASEYLHSPAFKRFTEERQRARAAEAQAAEQIKSQLAADKARMAPLLNMYQAGELSMEEWQVARAGLGERIRQAEDALAHMTPEDVSWMAAEGLPGAVWQAADLTERRQLLASIIDTIKIEPASVRGRRFDPSRIEIAWREKPTGPHPGDFLSVRRP